MYVFDCNERAVIELFLPYTVALIYQVIFEIWVDNFMLVEIFRTISEVPWLSSYIRCQNSPRMAVRQISLAKI
jgi:hypothetical protein